MSSQRFYTTGCAGKSAGDLLSLLERREAVLADIRLPTAGAADDEFAPRQLENLIGRKYHRVSQLGSRSMGAGEQSIAHLALGLRIIRSWEISVVLMCECREYIECHRSLVARELSRLNLPVEEITDWFDGDSGQPPALLVNQLPDNQKNNKQIKSERMESVAEIALNSGIISIQCGTPEKIVTREVAALVSGGLAIHEDANEPNIFALTHLASGRRICQAETRVQATLILSSLLKLQVNWTRDVPWQTEAEAVRLKGEIKNIMAKATRD